jgi:CubicO group peptidase (beta-lactamase class C family)
MSSGLVEKSAQVDELFSAWPEGNAPGAAVVVMQDGEVLYKNGYGMADLETGSPVRPQTVFRLASLTKQFTAVAIMMLAESGELSYDDSITRLLPEFASHARKITIRHLLTHTSGLQEYEALFLRGGMIDEDYPRSSKRAAGNFEPTSADVLRLLADETLRHAPGEHWEYGNSGYVLLAQIIERISGQSFSEFLRRHIFLPLGMNNSLLYDETRPEVPNRATSYLADEETYQDIDYTPLNLIYGQDGIYSTAEDMIKWCRSLGSEQLVAADAWQQAFTTDRLKVGANTGYGFGWFLGASRNLRRVAHTGSWAGFRNLLAFYPEERFVALVLSNFIEFDDPTRSAFASRLAGIYLSDKLDSPLAAKIAPGDLRQCAGEYESNAGESFRVTIEMDALCVKPSSLFPVRLVPESEVRFFVEGAEDDSYFFHSDERGNIHSLTRHLSLFGYSTDAYVTAHKVS